jgi:hypothetical protein
MDNLPLALTDGDGGFSGVSQLFGGDDKVSGVGMFGSCLDECVVGWSGDQGALVVELGVSVLVGHWVFPSVYWVDWFVSWLVRRCGCVWICVTCALVGRVLVVAVSIGLVSFLLLGALVFFSFSYTTCACFFSLRSELVGVRKKAHTTSIERAKTDCANFIPWSVLR